VTGIGLCFGGGQTLLGVTATIVASAALWLMRYVEAVTVPGRRGKISVTLSPDGPEERAILARLKERGFNLRSRRIKLLPNATTHLTYDGPLSSVVHGPGARSGGAPRRHLCAVGRYRLKPPRVPEFSQAPGPVSGNVYAKSVQIEKGTICPLFALRIPQ
jgi:hypothetical protein